MRVFIAVDIDDSVRAALGKLQKELEKASSVDRKDVKWVRPDDMHLTLKFLGEIEDRKSVEVCKTVEEVAKKHKSFELGVESVGYFGKNSATVLWVGTAAGSDSLQSLAGDLEGQLVQVGWPAEERPFTGHLTLCRIKNPRAGRILAQLAEQYKDFRAGTVQIDDVKVYQSILMPAGPVYTVLGKFKLG